MAKIYEIAFQIAGKLGSNFASTFLSAQKTIQNMDGQIKKLTSNQAKISRFDNLKRELVSTEQQFQAAQAKVKALADEMKAAEQPTKSLEKAFNKAKNEAGQLKDKVSEQQAGLSKMRGEMQQAGISTTNLAQHQRKLSGELDHLKSKKEAFTALQTHIDQFKSSTVSAFKSVSIAAGTCTAAVAGYTATAMGFANKAMDAAAHARVGMKLGFGAEQYQELTYAAKMSGVAVEDFDGCVRKMVVNLAKAKQDSKAGLGADLRKIGLTVEELNAAGPDKAIMKITEALQNVQDPAERTRMAVELFGKEGLNMMPMLKQGAAGIQAFRNEARQMGLVLDEQTVKNAAAYGKVKKQFANVMEGAKLTIGSALLPVLTTGAQQLMDLLKTNQGDIQAFAAQFADGLKTAIPYAIQFIKGMKDVASVAIDVTKGVAFTVGGFKNLAIAIGIAVAAKALWTAGSWAKDIFDAGKAAIALAGQMKNVSVATRIWAAAQSVLNAVMAANPVGVVLIGIAALIAAGYLVYKNWGTIKQWFISFWDSPASSVLLFAAGPIGWLIAAGVGLVQNWEAVKQWFVLLWDDPAAAFDQFIEVIKGKFAGVMDWFRNQAAWLKNMFSGPADAPNGPDVTPHASGGIFSRPHLGLVAEAGPEAIIPLANRSRGLSVWAKAGEMLGVNQNRGNGGTAFWAQAVRMIGLNRQSDQTTGGSGSTSLWTQAVRMIGLKRKPEQTTGQGGGTTFIYSPTNYFGNMTPQQVGPALEKDRQDFERQAEEYEARKRRVSFD